MPPSDTALERGGRILRRGVGHGNIRTAAGRLLSYRHRVLKGELALGLHRGLLLAVSLVMVPLAAHTLPRAEFGAWLLLDTIPAVSASSTSGSPTGS